MISVENCSRLESRLSLAKLNLLEKAETSTNRKRILHIKFDGAAGILRLNERSNDYLNVMNFT